MKEKNPYETKNIRILIRVLYGTASVIAAGLGIGITGCVEGTGREENIITMIIGFTIAIVGPFLLQVSYRLTLAPFDIIDLLRDRNNLDNETENLTPPPN